jgi:hypothetical protein
VSRLLSAEEGRPLNVSTTPDRGSIGRVCWSRDAPKLVLSMIVKDTF